MTGVGLIRRARAHEFEPAQIKYTTYITLQEPQGKNEFDLENDLTVLRLFSSSSSFFLGEETLLFNSTSNSRTTCARGVMEQQSTTQKHASGFNHPSGSGSFQCYSLSSTDIFKLR